MKCVRLSILALCSILSAQVVFAQQRATDPFGQVRNAIRQKDYPAAIDLLEQFLNAHTASIGDPNFAEGKRILLQVSRLHSAALDRAGSYIDAAHVLTDAAAQAALTDDSTKLNAEAKEIYQRSFKVCKAKKEAALALQVADAFAKQFPGDPPLLDSADRVQLELDGLKSAIGARPEALLREMKRLKAEGITSEQFSAAGISESDLIARQAEALLARGWYTQAASFAEAELVLGTAPAAVNARLAKVAERALSSYVEAAKQLGNAKILTDAVAQYADAANAGVDKAKLARYQALTKNLTSKIEPKPLEFAGKFVEGNGTWSDDGNGFMIVNRVQIGNSAHNHGGGDSKDAKITVTPGFVLSNGALCVSHGHLELKGSPDRPIVFQNVRIECEYTASISASYVIFIDCTMAKTGGWHWNNGYSSKWGLNDCFFVRSNFAGLSKGDYGIKLQRCTFLQCNVPDRSLETDATKDSTAIFHNQWNTIADCQFYQSKLRPSIFWANGNMVVTDCDIQGDSVFANSKNLDAEFGCMPDDAASLPAAIAATTCKGAGRVNYKAIAIDPTKLKPSALWRFVPNLPEDLKNDQ